MRDDSAEYWLDHVSAEECNEVEGGYLPLTEHELELIGLSDDEYEDYLDQ